MLYKISLSITTAKMPFLYYKSVKRVFCTRTDISAGGGYLINISIKVSIEVR